MLPTPKVWTVKQVAHYLDVSASTVYRLLVRGELTGFKIGSDWRFNQEDIEKWRLEHAKGIPDSYKHGRPPTASNK